MNSILNRNFFNLSVLASSYSWLFLFVMVPLILVLLTSLSYDEISKVPVKFFFDTQNNSFVPTFENYIEVLTDSVVYSSMLKSIKLACISTFICLIIGYPIAYSIYLADGRCKVVLFAAIIVPLWTSLIIRIYAWIIILQKNGLLNDLLILLHIIDKPLILLNTEFSVVIGIVYVYLPFMIVPICNSLHKIDSSIYESAQNLGASQFVIFWRIILPLSLPGAFTGTILVFTPVIGEFTIPDLLGGNNVFTIGKLLWSEFFASRNWVLSSTIAMILILTILLPIYFLSKYISNMFRIKYQNT